MGLHPVQVSSERNPCYFGGCSSFTAEILNIYLPATQMTSIFIGKDLVLEGWSPKIGDKQVPGIYTKYEIYVFKDYKRGYRDDKSPFEASSVSWGKWWEPLGVVA